MKKLTLYIPLLLTMLAVTACNHDDPQSFSEFSRNVFGNSANSEPVSVKPGENFIFTRRDKLETYSDLLGN